MGSLRSFIKAMWLAGWGAITETIPESIRGRRKTLPDEPRKQDLDLLRLVRDYLMTRA